jgi:hypothetical protein
MAFVMGDRESAIRLERKRDALLAEALRLDPERRDPAWSEADV